MSLGSFSTIRSGLHPRRLRRVISVFAIAAMLAVNSLAWLPATAVAAGEDITNLRLNTHNETDYQGVVVDFYVNDFTDATNLTVRVDRQDGSSITRTLNPSLLGTLVNGRNGPITSPFPIVEGSYTAAGDSAWSVSPASSSWSLATMPTGVTVTVQTPGGPVTETISGLGESDGPYADLLPPDTEAPTVLYTSPAVGAIVGDTNLSVELADGTKVKQYSFHVSGPGVSWNTRKWHPDNKTFVSVSDLNLCENDRLNQCDEDDLPSGTYSVKTFAYDGEGNDSRTVPAHTFVLDKDGPEVNIASPTTGSSVKDVLVDATIEDQKLSFYNVSLSKVGDPDWSFTTQKQFAGSQTLVTLADFDIYGNGYYGTCAGQDPCTSATGLPDDLPDGDYVVRINAYDEFGNRTIKSVSFSIDNTPPAVPTGLVIRKGHDLGNPAQSCTESDDPVYTNTTDILIDWNPSISGDVDYYWFGTKHKAHHKNSETSPSEFTDNETAYIGNMTPGHNPYYYFVSAVDAIGNESAAAKTCNVILDQEAPDVELTAPAESTYDDEVLEVRGTVQDDSPFHYYAVLKDSSGTVIDGPGTVGISGGIDVLSSFSDQSLFTIDTSLLPDGTYTAFLAARDQADNRDAGSEDQVEFTVSHVPVGTDSDDPEDTDNPENEDQDNPENQDSNEPENDDPQPPVINDSNDGTGNPLVNASVTSGGAIGKTAETTGTDSTVDAKLLPASGPGTSSLAAMIAVTAAVSGVWYAGRVPRHKRRRRSAA